MLIVVAAASAVALMAGIVYLVRERLGLTGVGLTILRTIGLTVLVLLLVNPGRTERAEGGAPIVLLDASLSMASAGGNWAFALDTARTIAGNVGTILRFGERVEPFDTAVAAGGASRLAPALRTARAMGGQTFVVTDGELDDFGSIAPSLLRHVNFVVVPRDSVFNTALLNVDLPENVQRDDSIRVSLSIGTWGANVTADTARIEVLVGDRIVFVDHFGLPSSAGVATRRIVLPPGALPSGRHVLRFRLTVDDDAEPGDDERLRVLNVTRQPAIVILVSPADWEGKFLVTELSSIARTSVRGYGLVRQGRWIDMRTLAPVTDESVRRAARQAGLLVIRAGRSVEQRVGRQGRPVWRWPAASDTLVEMFPGDWYVNSTTQPSPLAGRLARLEWDSLPPLTGIVPMTPGETAWVVMSARQARRGAERPVLVGSDSGGVRVLTMAGAGAWRWVFRGGASREAYRTLLAAGTDWLLGSDVLRRAQTLTSTGVVPRGNPVMFRWTTDSVPDSVSVVLRRDNDTTVTNAVLRFDHEGTALVPLPPGVYQWVASVQGQTRGLSIVEAYSDEFHIRDVARPPAATGAGMTLIERFARENLWLFALVVVALSGEWAWRYRRGLP